MRGTPVTEGGRDGEEGGRNVRRKTVSSWREDKFRAERHEPGEIISAIEGAENM